MFNIKWYVWTQTFLSFPLLSSPKFQLSNYIAEFKPALSDLYLPDQWKCSNYNDLFVCLFNIIIELFMNISSLFLSFFYFLYKYWCTNSKPSYSLVSRFLFQTWNSKITSQMAKLNWLFQKNNKTLHTVNFGQHWLVYLYTTSSTKCCWKKHLQRI